MKPTKREKRAYIDWLVSPAGTRPEPFLRPFTPGFYSRMLIWARSRCSGVRVEFSHLRRIFLPSPPRVKALALRRYARAFGTTVFVETGTATGQTTGLVADLFQRCTTIELSKELHAKALANLARFPHVACLQGDSGAMLTQVLERIDVPALFWLDAHASGGNTADAGYDPIDKELEAIYAHPVKRHVILIDDARGHAVSKITANAPASHEVSVRNDIIRIVPRRAAP
jgi:hypothetical protein